MLLCFLGHILINTKRERKGKKTITNIDITIFRVVASNGAHRHLHRHAARSSPTAPACTTRVGTGVKIRSRAILAQVPYLWCARCLQARVRQEQESDCVRTKVAGLTVAKTYPALIHPLGQVRARNKTSLSNFGGSSKAETQVSESVA